MNNRIQSERIQQDGHTYPYAYAYEKEEDSHCPDISRKNKILGDDDESEEKDPSPEEDIPIISCHMAVQSCHSLAKYATAHGMGGDIVDFVMKLGDDIQKERLRKRANESTQSTLLSYFKKD